MDFNKSVATTKRGGVVSIHASSTQVTTNIFNDGWYILPEGTEVCEIARNCAYVYPRADEQQKDYLKRILEAKTKLTTPLVKYTRSGDPAPSTEAASTATTTAAPKIKETITTTPVASEAERKAFCTELIKFFSEFNYVPSARFANTLCLQDDKKAVNEYIRDYFTLFDHPMVNQIVDKLKSPEWNTIVESALKMHPSKVINNRLTVLYGPPGTGKTTACMMEYPDAQVFACASDMTTSDLFRSFNFDAATGKTEFLPTPIVVAMKTGRVIILDELGLLPIDTLRAFQAVLDNKPKVTLPTGEEINIAEGFKVIATMNNTVNGQTISLPEPIVDRAGEIIYVRSSATLLAGCAFC